MKKFVFLLFSLCLFYVAGMYRYPALMVLAVGQLLLLAFLTVQAHVCKKHLNVRFAEKKAIAVKKESFPCELEVENGGWLPVGCIQFWITHGYGDKKWKEKRCAGSREEGTAFSVMPMYCGVEDITLEKIRIYDYLFLGFARKKISDTMQITVFSREFALDIRCRAWESEELSGENRTERMEIGNADEIRQIREYREGDQRSQFHWKLSARMEDLLVKEYEREQENGVELFLDLKGFDIAAPGEKDRFYELLYALLLGLLRIYRKVYVSWNAADKSAERKMEIGRSAERKMEIAEAAQCRALLMRLYGLAETGTFADRETGQETAETEKLIFHSDRRYGSDRELALDTKLGLYQGEKLLCQFSAEHLEEEIRKKRIVII